MSSIPALTRLVSFGGSAHAGCAPRQAAPLTRGLAPAQVRVRGQGQRQAARRAGGQDRQGRGRQGRGGRPRARVRRPPPALARGGRQGGLVKARVERASPGSETRRACRTHQASSRHRPQVRTLCQAGKYQTGADMISESNCSACKAGKYQSGSGMIAESNCSPPLLRPGPDSLSTPRNPPPPGLRLALGG